MALAKEKFIFDESIPIELIANTAERRRRLRWCQMMPCANECMIFLRRARAQIHGDSTTHTHSLLYYLLVLVEIVCRASLPAGWMAFGVCTWRKRFGFWILFSILFYFYFILFFYFVFLFLGSSSWMLGAPFDSTCAAYLHFVHFVPFEMRKSKNDSRIKWRKWWRRRRREPTPTEKTRSDERERDRVMNKQQSRHEQCKQIGRIWSRNNEV